VLLVEDDLRLAEDLIEDLRHYGFAVTHAASGMDAWLLIRVNAYDVLVVDRMMPQMGGITLIAGLRKAEIMTPILVLSGLDEISDRVGGLKAGADDYLVKPYALAELIARLEALLRRPSIPRTTMLTIGSLTIDLLDRRVNRNGREISLLPREFRLLEYMMRSAGTILTRDMLLKDVWNYRAASHTNLVDVHISKLRRKIDGPNEIPLILSIRGSGFIFRHP
jgi:two-component system OmpR family response regulator